MQLSQFPTLVSELDVANVFVALLLLTIEVAFLRGVLLMGGDGVKYVESNLIFLVVFAMKDPLGLVAEEDNFVGLAF